MLIASWNSGETPGTDEPRLVRWEDGSAASLLDYRTHERDTRTVVQNGDHLELHMFPSIVAEVRYDNSVRAWKLSGQGVIPTTLDITDPNAKNDEITMELEVSKIVYRAVIIR